MKYLFTSKPSIVKTLFKLTFMMALMILLLELLLPRKEKTHIAKDRNLLFVDHSNGSDGTVNLTRVEYVAVQTEAHIQRTTAIPTERKQTTSHKSPLSQPTNNITVKENVAPKTILFWNSFYKIPHFGLNEFGTNPFKRCKKIKTCMSTNDTRYLSKADAVVMHMRSPFYPFPLRQSQKQLYVFYLHEAPPNSFFSEKSSISIEESAMFNVTITYRADSDIPMMPYDQFTLRDPEERKPYRPLYPFKSKTKNVTWMSSHCRTPGRREELVYSLAKYIDVDIYGRCGDKSCAKHCEQEVLQKEYKFFITAENCVCKDYVSEKLTRGLYNEMIPIVYGGFNYTKYLPPHSFIDMRDYESPRHLAKYLTFVSSNEEEYYKYFDWKKKYRRRQQTKVDAMCRLCEILHDPTYQRTYPNIHNWWVRNTCSTEYVDNLLKNKLL